MSRFITSVAADDGNVYALANDGTLWKLGFGGNSWDQLPPLPDVERKSVSEVDRAARQKQAIMD